MRKYFALFLAACAALVGFADVESLEETGGYVTTEAQLAFKGITLADLGTTYVPSAKMSGGWVTADGLPVSFSVRTVADGVVRYQAQAVEGSVKAVAIEFTDGEGGVYVRANVDEGFYNSDLTKFGSDIYISSSISSSTFAGAIATSADSDTYGIHDLGLVSVDDLDAICLNFNHSNDSMVKTYEPVGPDAYAVTGFMWSQMLGTNNNTMNGVRLIDSVTSATLDLPSVTVTVTGTRGTYYDWRGTYSSASDVRYGYIDENENNATPTVTVSNVPFEFYRVVFIPSTDTENSKFGYITVNGRNYSSDNTEMATDRDYDIVADSTDAWGKTQNAAYLHGVNYLVTPVLAATSDGSVKVVGHKSNGRGCIAAIQIVRADRPETLYAVTATGDVTWSTKAGLSVDSGAWASGNSIRLVNNLETPVTVTFDEAVDASELAISGSGTTAIKFSDPAYNQIGLISFADVVGEVVLDDYMQTLEFVPPAVGAVRYGGEAALESVPCANGAITYTVIVDQPVDVSEFALAGVKSDYRFGENMSGSFARFILGNGGGSNQTVTQQGGSITVTGSNENWNEASILLGHWGNLTVNLNTYAGTFTALNAAVRLGHTGKCYWTIGDGVSEDNAVAVVSLKGIANQNAADYNGGTGSKVVTRNGGTLNLGESGIALPNSSVEFSGGRLVTTHDSPVSITASSITATGGTVTELNTASGLIIASTISGAGNIRKTGAGTLTLSTSATATGTLTVEDGVLNMQNGAIWAGTVVLGENGTLNIVLDADTLAETPYIDICGSLDASVGTITINGDAIGDIGWTLRGARVVNQSLTGVMRTATKGFMFSSAGWLDATGEAMTVDWGSSIAEVRVKAENEQPAYAGVDVNAAQVKKFAVEGAGYLTFYSSGEGAISAETFDFTGSTGAIDYQLSTGDSPVASGADTRLSGGGSGDVAVASGNTATLGPWGATEDGVTYSYSGMFKPAAGATMVFNPGEGNTQKVGGFDETSQSTTIAVTNGTLVVDKAGGGESVFFGANSVRIDDGGIVSLEAQDALGYSNARTVTINRGGILSVKVRDTLKRTVALNGGTLEVQGKNSGRALDFFNGNIITVTDNSLVQGIATEDESNPKIYFRDDSDNQSNTITVNIDDGISMVNNVTYAYSGKVTVRGTMNNGVGNGSMVMNGFNNNPLTFTGLATIGESGKPVMYKLNCEHQNGIYTVNAASRFMGSGSVTGNGGVTLAAANSKICGSLTINNVTATSGGTFGDQWNSVAAKIADSFTASGTQTIENGSLTLLDTCTVTNSAGVANATDASFNIMSNGRLVLATSLEVGGLTVADGGTIVLAASRNAANAVRLTVKDGAEEPSYSGKVNIVLDFGDEGVPGNFKVALPPGLTAENASVTDLNGRKRWRIEDGYAVSNGGLYFIIR